MRLDNRNQNGGTHPSVWLKPVTDRRSGDSANCDSAPALPAELQRLKETLHHAAHLLPAQGTLGVFIHHNPLHAFEHLTFDEAVRAGSRVFGCEPYLSEDRYREELSRGRIRSSELNTVLKRDRNREVSSKQTPINSSAAFRWL